MRNITSSILVVLFCAGFILAQTKLKTNDVLIKDNGWGDVKIGDSLNEVESILGKANSLDEVGNVIFANYNLENKFEDVLIIYFAENKKVGAIYFLYYPGTKRTPLKTDKGITWNSTEGEVLKGYGEPKNIKEDQIERNLYYEGISFSFRNKQLFRILLQDKTKIEFH